MKKLLIIIPARKGSKRLKNKNVLKLGSKSLVEKTIIFAKKLVTKNKIILSSDSKKIQQIGIKHQIFAPWLRPPSLSQNYSTTSSVVLHAIKWYEKEVAKISGILLLQPTTPFRSKKYFKKAISRFFKNSKNNFVSIHSLKRRDVKKNLVQFKGQVIEKKKKLKYFLNGSMYLISAAEFKLKKKFITNLSIGIPINKKKFQIDIDYLSDLKKARKYL